MPKTPNVGSQPPSLEEKYLSLFPNNNRWLPVPSDELWLEQPIAQKVVKSTTSSSSFELPEAFNT
jgi:hypothetical protein